MAASETNSAGPQRGARTRRRLICCSRHRFQWPEALPWLIAIAAFFVFPDRMTFGSQVLIMVMFALSLDLILGYAGIVTLGHAAFFGIGAYTVGLWVRRGLAGPSRSAACSPPRSWRRWSASSPAGSCCAIAA